MDNPITFKDVKQSEYPQENISRHIESKTHTINELLKKERYQLNIKRYKRVGFLKLTKLPVDPFIDINLFNITGRESIYYDTLNFKSKAIWLTRICEEIQKQYNGWNVKYKLKSVDAKFEIYWTCRLYFRER